MIREQRPRFLVRFIMVFKPRSVLGCLVSGDSIDTKVVKSNGAESIKFGDVDFVVEDLLLLLVVVWF